MANDKFKGCFIDDSDLYTYSIEWQGMKLAEAHTLSAKDRSAIERNSVKKKYNITSGEIEVDIDTNAMKTWNILGAITKWELGRELNEESVSKLSEPLRDFLFGEIQAHETAVAAKVEDTEKN
jgi:hypothetical protein